MPSLSKPALQHLLLDRMKYSQGNAFTMEVLHRFYTEIMSEIGREKLYKISAQKFEDYIYEFRDAPKSWLSMRHEKANLLAAHKVEVFYLTVDMCPIDSWKIKRLLCGFWYDGHCKKHH